MCGRVAQARPSWRYAREMGWPEGSPFYAPDPTPNFNAPPGTSRQLMHQLDGKPHIDQIPWGYVSPWGKSKGLRPGPNARLDKARGSYWRILWKSGRAILPAEGWYEWTGPKGNREPWYIHAKNDQTLFIAALTNYKPGEEIEGLGFSIVTDDAAGGMIDVHDRRPVVLPAAVAMMWMDMNLSAEQAEELARHAAVESDAFEWYRVSTDVNSSRINRPDLVDPLP